MIPILLMSLFLICFGGLLLFFPRLWFDLTESWKHDSSTEPSDAWITYTRFGGGMTALVGLCGLLSPLLFDLPF